MKYFKAEILYSSERFIDDDPSKGCDPDTFVDHGISSTETAKTLEDLKKKLEFSYGPIEHFEGNQYGTGFEETALDGITEAIGISIFIYEVNETEVNFEPEEA